MLAQCRALLFPRTSSKTCRFEEGEIESSFRFQFYWLILEVVGAFLFQTTRWLELLMLGGVWLLPPLCISAGVRGICLWASSKRRPLVHNLAMLCLFVDVVLLTTCHPEVSHNFKVWCPDEDQGSSMVVNVENVTKTLNKFESRMKDVADFDEGQRNGESGPWNIQDIMRKMTAMTNFKRDVETIRWLEKEWMQVKKVSEEWHQIQEDMRDKYVHDHQLVVSGHLMQFWYMTTFVLPFRKALLVNPVAFTAAVLIVCCLGRGPQEDAAGRPGDGMVSLILWEFLILAFGIVVNLLAKLRSEQSQRALCAFMDKQQQQVIQEKVLRCEAEWEKEQLQEDLGRAYGEYGLESISESFAKVKGGPASIASIKGKKAPSLRSAPPATRGFMEGNLDCGTRSRGDCLPPGASVWVEGQPLPTSVAKVTQGQRVLCFDTVGRCPKFVEVTDLRILMGEVQWVQIALTDGTELSVTANHPMQPQPLELDDRGLPFVGTTVLAKDLKPGSDCLMVMKMVPVPVKTLTSTSEFAGKDTKRVSLLLRQPDRHEVFVAPPNAAAQSATVAVGSANAAADSPDMRAPMGPVVKRTFIDVGPTDGKPQRRTSSLPPELDRITENASSAVPPPPEPFPRERRERRPISSRRIRMKRSNSDSEFSSSFRSSESGGGADIVVAMDQNQAPTDAHLSQLLRAKQLGLPSIGSAGHASGNCQVCFFANRHQHEGKDPCWKGLLCDRCHECHEPLEKRKHKSGGMRRYLKRVAANSVVLDI